MKDLEAGKLSETMTARSIKKQITRRHKTVIHDRVGNLDAAVVQMPEAFQTVISTNESLTGTEINAPKALCNSNDRWPG